MQELNPIQEPVDLNFDPSNVGQVKPNTYTPEITNRAVPALNFFQAPEVPGWEYEDYRKWVDEVQPFDKEIGEQIQGKQKELEEAVSIGAITPRYADNQLQEFSEALFQEVEPRIVQATKKMFTIPRVEKIEKKEKLIDIKDPVQFETELYNPADYGQIESKLNTLESRRQKAEAQLNALPDNEAERRVELETEIALIDSQKRQFKLPTVKPIYVDKEGEGNVYVVDGQGAENRVVERKFIPEGPVYDQDQLKEGDIIDLPQVSKVWFKTNKGGQDYFLGVDTQEYKFKDGTKERPQGFRVYKENGELKLEPLKQVGIDQVFTPANKDEAIDPNELADRMELYSKQTGSNIFTTILYKEQVDGNTRLRSGLYGDFVDDYNELAEYFYNRPELATEFGKWAKENAWDKAYMDERSTPDIQRVMNAFFDSKKEEKMKLREQTGIKDTDARLAYEAQGVIERNQVKFLEYKERKLKEIESLREEYKRNPSEDLKNKTEKLIAAYNKSYENYKTFAESQGQYLGIASDPSFVKYDKISKEIDDLEEARILNNKYFRANIPSTERLAAGAAKTQVGDATVGSAIESVNNAVVGKLGQMITGMAGFFSDGETYGRVNYYSDIVKNFNNSQRFREEDANGKTIWKNYLTNRAQDAGQAGVDIASMILAPEVKWFKSSYLNRLPGLFGTISATNYNQAYNEAKEAGLSGEGRHAYAMGNMLINTMFEGMFDVKKLFKGLDTNAIDVLRQRYKGEVGKHLPEIVNQATRKQGLLNLVTTARDFAKVNFSPKGLANSFISSAEEMILEEGLTDAALNLFNIGINRAFRTNLDEEVFTEKSMKDLFFTGLIMAPFMGAGRSLNTAISLNDGKNVIYQVANEVGYDKVIGQLQLIPKGNEIAEELLREMPYAATIKKPEDISDDRWFFLQEKTAKRQFLAAKIDQMSEPLKPYYKEQVRMMDEEIQNIMSLPEEAIVKRRAEVEGSFKESLTKLLESPKDAVNEPVNDTRSGVKPTESSEIIPDGVQSGQVIALQNEGESQVIALQNPTEGVPVVENPSQISTKNVTENTSEETPKEEDIIDRINKLKAGSDTWNTSLKEAMLENPERAKLAFELRDLAAKVWNMDLGSGDNMSSLSMFFYGDANTPQEFLNNQIKDAEGNIARMEESKKGLGKSKADQRAAASYDDQINSAKEKIKVYEKELENYKPVGDPQIANQESSQIVTKSATGNTVEEPSVELADSPVVTENEQVVNLDSNNSNQPVQNVQAPVQVDGQAPVEAESKEEAPTLESIAEELFEVLNTEEEKTKDKARNSLVLLGKQLQGVWSKMVPNLKVVSDNYLYNVTQAKLNGEVEGELENYPGFYNPKTNTVYLNPQKVGLDTPIHEFGHVWYQIASQSEKGRKLIARGKQLIKGSPYLAQVQAMEEYKFPDETPERREELQLEEALITAIGNRGADFVEQSMRNQFVDWLLELLDAINVKIKQFKGKKIDLSTLSLDAYLDLAAADILSGGEVFTIDPTDGAYSAATTKPTIKAQVTSVGEEMAKEKLPSIKRVFEIIESEEGSQGGSLYDSEYGDARFESKAKAIEYAKEIKEILEGVYSQDLIPVYRAVSANEVDLTPYGIGESWSFDLNAAKAFGSRLGGNVKIISGLVPKGNVDWEQAARVYYLFSDRGDGDSEFEIPIPSNRVIKGVTVSDYKDAKEVSQDVIDIERSKVKKSVASTRRVESIIPDVQSKVRKAEDMESKGTSPEEIYQQTGLSRGVEGAWEAELDYDVKLNKGVYLQIIKQQVEKSGNKIYKLRDVISYPQLFKAYPELRDKRVIFISDPDKIWIGATNDKGDIGINLADDVQIEQEEVAYRMGYFEPDAVDKAYISTIIHEIQHLIQRIEDWPGGFNLREAFDIAKEKIAGFFQKEAESTGDQEFLDAANQISSFTYDNQIEDDLYETVRIAAERRYNTSSGEQQARNVQRRFLDPSKRSQSPQATESTPRAEQQQDRIQVRLSVGENWGKEAEDTAQSLLYNGRVEITPNPDGTFTVAGKVKANTYKEAEAARDKIIQNVLLKKYPQISPWVAEGIVNRAKDKNVFRPVPTFRGEGVTTGVQVRPYVADSRSTKDKIFAWASSFFREYFTSTKGVSKDIFNLKGRRIGSIDLLINEAEGIVKETRAIAKKIGFEDWALFDEELRNYNTQVPGNSYSINMQPNRGPQLEQGVKLPEEMQEQMIRMRTILDGISEQLIRNGYVTPDLALTIQKNMGKYVHRSYAMFTMGDEWTKQLNTDPKNKWILDNAKDHLTQLYAVNLRAANPYLTNDEISLQANDLANKEIDSIMKTRKSFFGKDGSSFLPYRNTDSLKYRKDMPQWLRDLLGEYTDPGTAFLLSVAETSNLLHNSMYLQDLYRLGRGEFIFEEFDSNRPREANIRIDAPTGSMLTPLNGKYVTKEMYDHLMDSEETAKGAWRWFLKVMNLNKTFKTVFSLGTQAKNFLNNTVFALNNGNLTRTGWKQAKRYLAAQITGNKKLSDIKELEPLFVRGLLSQNITARELDNIFRSNDYEQYILDSANIQKTLQDKLVEIGKKPIDSANKAWRGVYRYFSRLYQASDSFWKIQAFFSERSKLSPVLYGKGYETLTQEEKDAVDNEAADRVMNTYPSYDRALKAFLVSGKIPVLGNFTAFKAEMYRTLWNQYAYAIKDTRDGIREKNPAKTRMGLTRMFGAITHNTIRIGTEYLFAKAFGYGVSGASAILANLMPGDDEEPLLETRSAANTFVAPWARSDDKVFDLSKVGETGEITYWIGSNIDPTQGVYNLLNAYLDGNEYYPQGGAKAVASEFVLPFLEPEMTVRMVMESITGYDDKGKLYAEDDQAGEKIVKGFWHVAKNMVPSTFTLADRITTVKDEAGMETRGINTDELWGVVGFRPYKQNIKWGIYRIIKKQEELINVDIKKDFNKDYREGEQGAAEANERYRRGIELVKQAYEDAIKLGFNTDELNSLLKSSRLPKNAKNYIRKGTELKDLWDEYGRIGSKYRFDD